MNIRIVLSLVVAAKDPSFSFSLTNADSTASTVRRSFLRAGNYRNFFTAMDTTSSTNESPGTVSSTTATTTNRLSKDRDLASSTAANKKKKTPPPTSVSPTAAPTPWEEEEGSSSISSSTPLPTPKPHKKDKHAKVSKETEAPTATTVVSEEADATPSPTPKPHKKNKDAKKPKQVVSSLSPTSSLAAAEEKLIEDEISMLETEASIIDALLGNLTNTTDGVWNETNVMNTTINDNTTAAEYYDSYGNSKTPTEVSSTESNAATLQDELIKNIDQEEEEEEEEKQAISTSNTTATITDSPTPTPISSGAPVKPKKGENATLDKNNESESNTTSTQELSKDNFTATTTTPYDDFVQYYEEIIEEYEGSSSAPTKNTSTTKKTYNGGYYYYYDDKTEPKSTTTTSTTATEEEEYDLTKVTTPTSSLDVTTTTTTSTSKEAETVGKQTGGDQSYYDYSTTPITSEASFTKADQQQISPAQMKWMTFGMLIAMLFFMIYTAYQVSDNPDGIYANCCRLSVAVAIYVIRGLLTPCRAICCRYTLISNSTPDYREPYRGRRGHMELT